MARTVHVYIHDAGWEESKHQRASNGEFGSGGSGAGNGTGAAPDVATLKKRLAGAEHMLNEMHGNGNKTPAARETLAQQNKIKALKAEIAHHEGRALREEELLRGPTHSERKPMSSVTQTKKRSPEEQKLHEANLVKGPSKSERR